MWGAVGMGGWIRGDSCPQKLPGYLYWRKKALTCIFGSALPLRSHHPRKILWDCFFVGLDFRLFNHSGTCQTRPPFPRSHPPPPHPVLPGPGWTPGPGCCGEPPLQRNQTRCSPKTQHLASSSALSGRPAGRNGLG